MRNTKIGFIGLGLMGAPIANRLLESGYPLCVYNRTKDKASSLLAKGAQWENSPSDVARQSEIIFSMISNSDVLRDIALGKNGILRELPANRIHIDMSTVSPSVTHELEEKYLEHETRFVHSPVLGSVPQATEGTLLLFVGGDGETFERVEPILKKIGSTIWRFEKAEQASSAKIVCNSFIAGMFATLAQGMIFAAKAGIDGEVLLDILAHSALNSSMFQSKGKSILDRNFSPRFFVEHMFKDINLMIEAGKSLEAPTPVAELTRSIFESAIHDGWGKEDYSAAIKSLEKSAGIVVQSRARQ
jgi:3-hydroxyisobutyrate dehydrogenase-like beta-hydroxyacid dehydrogenase